MKKSYFLSVLLVFMLSELSGTNSSGVNNKLKSSIFSNKHVNKSTASLPKCSLEKSETTCVAGNKCIKHFQICDGFADCPDRTDESNCECIL